MNVLCNVLGRLGGCAKEVFLGGKRGELVGMVYCERLSGCSSVTQSVEDNSVNGFLVHSALGAIHYTRDCLSVRKGMSCTRTTGDWGTQESSPQWAPSWHDQPSMLSAVTGEPAPIRQTNKGLWGTQESSPPRGPQCLSCH